VSVIVKLNFWSDDMVLAETFSSVSGVELRDYRAIAADPHRPHLFFWTRAPDFDRFESAMATDETVAEYECYGERTHVSETERLYRIHVSEATEVVLYPAWVQSKGDVIDGGYADGRWYGRMRFSDREGIDRLRRSLDDSTVDLSIEAVYTGPETVSAALTDQQRRTLALAAEQGYFDIPREASLADLANELDISQQAVSERLRRAYRTLADRHVE